ncbi:hypothetical protein ONZ45_g9499 [Pleurotus djamor]|nr:hypothetical protein ONZ45_g9499 [Pleurotus djamor]
MSFYLYTDTSTEGPRKRARVETGATQGLIPPDYNLFKFGFMIDSLRQVPPQKRARRAASHRVAHKGRLHPFKSSVYRDLRVRTGPKASIDSAKMSSLLTNEGGTDCSASDELRRGNFEEDDSSDEGSSDEGAYESCLSSCESDDEPSSHEDITAADTDLWANHAPALDHTAEVDASNKSADESYLSSSNSDVSNSDDEPYPYEDIAASDTDLWANSVPVPERPTESDVRWGLEWGYEVYDPSVLEIVRNTDFTSNAFSLMNSLSQLFVHLHAVRASLGHTEMAPNLPSSFYTQKFLEHIESGARGRFPVHPPVSGPDEFTYKILALLSLPRQG